jgi:hypothetical protein
LQLSTLRTCAHKKKPNKTTVRDACGRFLICQPKGADTSYLYKLLVLLAGLVSYGAGSLACGLAGCLALAAAALLDGIL